MSCLGERLTALVDGELGHEERERALRHLAGCASCRAEADALRRLKARLRGLATPPDTSAPDRGLPGLPDLSAPDLPGLSAPGLADLSASGLSDLSGPGLPGGRGASGVPGLGDGSRDAGAGRAAASSAEVPDDMPTPDFLARLRGLGESLAAADGPSAADPARRGERSDHEGAGEGSGSGAREDAVRPADVTRPDELPDLGGSWVVPPARSRQPWASPSGGTTRPGRPRDNRPPVSAGRSRARHAPVASGAMAGAAAFGPMPGGSVGPGAVRAGRTHRKRYLAVGAASLFLGLGVASYAAGGNQDAPTVTPAFDRFAVQHALTSGDTPITDPLTDPGTLRTAVPSAPEP
ncbi:zf-HC2 domain-containing protein [Actinomadura oligospora]|uniref:zf-HC2 domain-containing protein n=1 Tax=Actinomadura oligospora TaxID=111804 RepID=UPI00047C0FA4